MSARAERNALATQLDALCAGVAHVVQVHRLSVTAHGDVLSVDVTVTVAAARPLLDTYQELVDTVTRALAPRTSTVSVTVSRISPMAETARPL